MLLIKVRGVKYLMYWSALTELATLKSASQTIAKGLMSYYPTSGEVGIFGAP